MTNHDFTTLPRRVKDKTGIRFGRWTVVKFAGRNKHNQILWFCRCDCGNYSEVTAGALSSGTSKSCGCFRKEEAYKATVIHGCSEHPLYRTWVAMVHRCCGPTNKDYASYGGRGITVFDGWKENPHEFINYVSSLPNCGVKGYTLDRLNNDGNYEPGNVKWSTHLEQGSNKRSCQNFTYLGITQCLSAWARDFGMTRRALSKRLKRGWSIGEALTMPVRSQTYR